MVQEVAVAGVRLLRRAKAGEHADRPLAPAVAGGVDAACIGVLAGVTKIFLVVEVGLVHGAVEALNGAAGSRDGRPGGFTAAGDLRLLGGAPLGQLFQSSRVVEHRLTP